MVISHSAFHINQRLKPLLMMQSLPTQTGVLTREGGFSNMSNDFNRAECGVIILNNNPNYESCYF
jgi:hypothetical protein